MVTFKIVTLRRKTKLYETNMWNAPTHVQWDMLLDKVQSVTNAQTGGINLFSWDGNTYVRIKCDEDISNLLNKLQSNGESEQIVRIYVTIDKKDPSKLYGKTPYDVNVLGTVEKRKSHRHTNWLSRRQSSRPMPSRPPNQYSHGPWFGTLSRTQTMAPSNGLNGPPYSNFHSQATTSARLTHAWSTPNLSPAQEVTVDNEGMGLAIQTLRSMGYEQDDNVLKFYISSTNGNLNEIIDILEAHNLR
ncbi:hypothetical protein CSKR_106595 [Clonorchis sinensis]|uniref:Uncharacterized protein n=1 Tax=Clonorchis sinensis TaxID=79923 RepID=A0A3R7HBQ2_CLOSI|nr:hypothetical protein CSKR_106595 [Clonorchis sinensis]